MLCSNFIELILFILQVPNSEYIIAARCALSWDLANKYFLRPKVIGLITFSTKLLSISTWPSSTYFFNIPQRLSVFANAIPMQMHKVVNSKYSILWWIYRYRIWSIECGCLSRKVYGQHQEPMNV